MTDKPTPEQIQRACDLANCTKTKVAAYFVPGDYGIGKPFTALADTIAELDAEKARADKAVADLRGIDRIAVKLGWDKACHIAGENILAVAAIAAPYRVETDPLVAEAQEMFSAMLRQNSPDGLAEVLGAFVAKRGLEIGRSA